MRRYVLMLRSISKIYEIFFLLTEGEMHRNKNAREVKD